MLDYLRPWIKGGRGGKGGGSRGGEGAGKGREGELRKGKGREGKGYRGKGRGGSEGHANYAGGALRCNRVGRDARKSFLPSFFVTFKRKKEIIILLFHSPEARGLSDSEA